MILGIKKVACQPLYTKVKTHTNHRQIYNLVLNYTIAQIKTLSSPRPKRGEHLCEL